MLVTRGLVDIDTSHVNSNYTAYGFLHRPMQQIVMYFWQLCLLRASPERIPGNTSILAMIFVVYAFFSLVTMWITEDRSVMAMIAKVVVSVVVQAGLIYGLLLFKQLQGRFIATLAALLGTTAVILLLMLPANYLFVHIDTPTMRVIAGALFLFAFIWRLAISGAILSKAARISILQGAAIMFGMQLIELSINQNLLTISGQG